jgi:hypothetical protein
MFSLPRPTVTRRTWPAASAGATKMSVPFSVPYAYASSDPSRENAGVMAME